MQRKFHFNTRINNSFFYYKIRFIRYSRYQKVFYKLVVVNRYNTVLAHLGFYNPFSLGFRVTYKKFSNSSFFAKVVAIDKVQVIFWLKKGAYPTPVTSLLLEQMGLFKTYSVSPYYQFSESYLKKRKELLFLNSFFNEKFLYLTNLTNVDVFG